MLKYNNSNNNIGYRHHWIFYTQ